MMKKIVILLTIFIFVEGYTKTAATGWWILRRPQSTKPKSLTTVAAVRGDLSGVFYNPSILGTLTQPELFLLSELGLGNDIFGGVLIGGPIKTISAGICLGAIYYDAGRETLYWMEGDSLKEREVSVQKDTLGILSFGKRVNEKVYFGVTAKFASSNIAELSESYAYAGDIGLLFNPVSPLMVSFSIQNFGSSTKFIAKSEELPLSVWLGSSYLLQLTKISYFSFGVEIPYILKEERTIPSVGIEYGVGALSINSGYRFGVNDGLLHIGVGLVVGNLDLGYAFIPATYLTSTHRVTLGLRF